MSSGPLHQVWQQATTMSFLGIVACQIGTAMAARTQHASLLQVGVLTNRLLLWGIAYEVVFARRSRACHHYKPCSGPPHPILGKCC